jgi:hypothetical protein
MSERFNERFHESVRRLRGNPDYEELVRGLKDLLQSEAENLAYRQDSIGTHRLQGSVVILTEILKDLAP